MRTATRLLPAGERWTEYGPLLTADTEPSVIEATHRRLVRGALPGVLADWRAAGFAPTRLQLAECLSGVCDLPVFNIERVLAQLRRGAKVA